MTENLKERLRRICLAYHQRGLERTWQEIKEDIQTLRYKDGLSLREALDEIEADAVARYADEE